MPNPFTVARLAVWESIDRWPALNPGGKSVFSRKRRLDGSAREIAAASADSIADLNSITIRPGNTQIAWDVNTEQKIDYVVNVIIKSLKLPILEQLVCDVWDGIYQQPSIARPAISCVRDATDYNPLNLQVTWQASSENVNGKAMKCEQATIAVGLRFNRDPFNRPPG